MQVGAGTIAQLPAVDVDPKSKKTRYRVPTVCSLCRRRKMKCDKQRPHCTSCVKNRTTHLCHYEEQPWAADNEVQKLKEQIFQLQHQNNELKNLLNKRTAPEAADPRNTGLIIPGVTESDPVLELTKSFDVLMLKENKMAHYGSSSYMAVVSQDPVLRNMFKRFTTTHVAGINFERFFLYDQGIMSLPDHGCGALAPNTPGSIFEHDLGKDHESLVSQINEILPNKDVLLALVDHFFAESYAFVPYLHEVAFRKNIESLVSATPTGKASFVVSSVSQLVTVATLLVVLRFAFISLPLKKSSPTHNHVVKKILDSDVLIPPKFIEYAKACIANASALRKPTLKHIQALLLLRLYRYYAPEDGDESTDSTIFLALIVQMALMHGLHRDPSRFSMVKDIGTINTWRKIWIQLMYLDAVQALQFGCPLLIDDEYDTELPVPTSADTALEKNCIESLIKMNEVAVLMRQLIRASSKIKEHPKRSDIEKLLRDVEYTIMKYRTIADLTNFYSPTETFLMKLSKMKELVLKLMLYNLYSVFNYILMLTCDNGEFLSLQKYTTRAAESAFIVLRVAHDYAKDPSRYHKTTNMEPFLAAHIFDVTKRLIQEAISFTFRDLSGMFNLKKIVEGFNMPDSLGIIPWLTPLDDTLTTGDQCIIRIEEFVQSCSKLANRYFTCWRMVFVNKLFEDYIDEYYPGKFEELHQKVAGFGDSGDTANTLKEAHEATEGSNVVNEHLNEMWQQLVDTANQSKFDYLVPDISKFDKIGDPYYDNMAASAVIEESPTESYPPFDEMMQSTTQFMSFGSFSSMSDPKGSTDEVSPKTDSSDASQNLATTIDDPLGLKQQMSSSVLDTPSTEQELAMQVARSMFGGFNGNNNDYFSGLQ